MSDPTDILVQRSSAAVTLESILGLVIPGDGAISQVREDILKMFEQRVGTLNAEPPERLSTMGVLFQVALERANQRNGGYDDEHDDTHIDGELGRFAAAMIIPEELYRMTDPKTGTLRQVLPMEEVPEGDGDGRKEFRPWRLPKAKDADRVDLLLKAIAVLVAEVERLLRVREVERCAVAARKIATKSCKIIAKQKKAKKRK